MTAHFVRTSHHDTGAVEFYCGGGLDGPRDVPRGTPICADCCSAIFRDMQVQLDTLAARAGDRSWLGHYDAATLRIERLEKRLAKIEGKGKRR